jgi:isoquinoline 1-oxidoreductase subunit alpha
MAATIKVNGVGRTVDVDGDTPLLWVLRDVLGMTGTKFGCGMTLCGACTVHVDGAATRSCVTTIDSIGSSEITTIETIGATAAGQDSKGLARPRGRAMRLLPVGPDHVDAMSGNICRCGTYLRIREAIKEADNQADRGADDDPRSPRRGFLGQRLGSQLFRMITSTAMMPDPPVRVDKLVC